MLPISRFSMNKLLMQIDNSILRTSCLHDIIQDAWLYLGAFIIPLHPSDHLNANLISITLTAYTCLVVLLTHFRVLPKVPSPRCAWIFNWIKFIPFYYCVITQLLPNFILKVTSVAIAMLIRAQTPIITITAIITSTAWVRRSWRYLYDFFIFNQLCKVLLGVASFVQQWPFLSRWVATVILFSITLRGWAGAFVGVSLLIYSWLISMFPPAMFEVSIFPIVILPNKKGKIPYPYDLNFFSFNVPFDNNDLLSPFCYSSPYQPFSSIRNCQIFSPHHALFSHIPFFSRASSYYLIFDFLSDHFCFYAYFCDHLLCDSTYHGGDLFDFLLRNSYS
jgi:hypothetical protein